MKAEDPFNQKQQIVYFERIISAIAVLSCLLLSVVIFTYQIIFYELPCPLCLLTRFGFLAIAFGFLLNLRFGLRSSHYSLVLLASLFTCFVALRQINLNIAAGSGYYGAILFGFHLPTWAFAISLLLTIVTGILLGRDYQYEKVYSAQSYWKSTTHPLFALLSIILFANTVSAFLLCGLDACPDKPTGYKMLSDKVTKLSISTAYIETIQIKTDNQ